MTQNEMFALGSEGFDTASGFTGTIIAHARYLGGVRRYLLVAKAADNKVGIEEWFDEGRVTITPDGQEAGTNFGYSKRSTQ